MDIDNGTGGVMLARREDADTGRVREERLANGLVVGDDGLARPPWAAAGVEREYYDTEWGVPVTDERGVFERLALEGFQAGLSWALVLRRREQLREAFCGFEPDVVADFTDDDVERLCADDRVIRHRHKIASVVRNADATLALRDDGGLARLVWSYRPEVTPVPQTPAEVGRRSAESAALAAELHRRGFRFVGPATIYALMQSVGVIDDHVVGSHRRGCSGLWHPDGTRACDPDWDV